MDGMQVTDPRWDFPEDASDDGVPLRIDGWSVPAPPSLRLARDLHWPMTIAALGAGMATGIALRRAGGGARALMAGALALAGSAMLRRRGPWFQIRYEIPELNDPPQELPGVPVAGHGTVHRGRTEAALEGGGTRPYLWLWIEPAAGGECRGTYRWYQFVRPRLSIEGKAKRSDAPFRAATGLDYRLDRWNPDYHVAELAPTDPDFTPDGLGLDAHHPGKPFRHYEVPGTHTGGGTSALVGVLDAPNFCVRSADGQSQAERFLGRFIEPHERQTEQAQAPPDRVVRVRIEVEGRSYLVCVHDGPPQCIGYVPWTYTNDVGVRLTWSEAGVALGTARRWVLGSELTDCRARLDIGDWVQPC